MDDYSQIDQIFSDVQKFISDQNLKYDNGEGDMIPVSPEFMRSDQDFQRGEEVKYPFATYRVINEDIEDPFSHIHSDIEDGFENGDTEKPFNKHTREVKERLMVSVNSISESADGLDLCRIILKQVLSFFYDADLTDAVAFINGRQIQNRSVAITGEVEYKLGFDFIIETCQKIETETEAVRVIAIETKT